MYFNCLISGGLIVGSAIYVFRTQRDIVETIEQTFLPENLAATRYGIEKQKYLSKRRSTEFATEFIVAGFVIFYLCRFPLTGLAETFMIAFACMEYALGVYVGRKLYYAGSMLETIADIKIHENIFSTDKLGSIIAFVNIVSTMTIIFVYVHVSSFYFGPFLYDSDVGWSAKILLILPAVIATPVVLIFNFYPRTIIRNLYKKSIDQEIFRLTDSLHKEGVTKNDRMSTMMQYHNLQDEELKYRLRVTLSDLPIAITVILMLLKFVVP